MELHDVKQQAALPRVEGLASIDDATWTALGARLRELGVTRAYREVAKVAGAFADVLARPLRVRRLATSSDPSAHAMRWLLLGDAATVDAAHAVMGPLPLDRFVEAGLFQEDERGLLVPAFTLRTSGDTLVFADELAHGGDAVMGIGRMTVAVARAAYEKGAGRRALDLGCGAGACALLLADGADEVVATDINPRAVRLARINVALNGLRNVTVVEGDLYAPVAGKAFERIVSQPPFVPRPREAAGATYLYGGDRGDELPLRALRELAPHLAAGGRAVFFVQWPVTATDSVLERVRRAVELPDAGILLVSAPPLDADAYSVTMGLELSAEAQGVSSPGKLSPEYAATCLAYREHLSAFGVGGVAEAFTVIDRSPRRDGFAAEVVLEDLEACKLTGAHVGALVAAHDLLACDDDTFMTAKLRLPKGTKVARYDDGAAELVFSTDWFLERIHLSPDVARLVTLVQDTSNVKQAVDRLAKALKLPVGDVRDDAQAVLEKALAGGMLTVVP